MSDTALISIDNAYDLVERVMTTSGLTGPEARIVSEHVVGCELRGVLSGGFSRAISIAERLKVGGVAGPMVVKNETPVSALIDGGDQAGYLVAHRATQIAILKAKTVGIAVVAANNTWYTGMYAHYMEMVTNEGLVAMCVGSSAPRVAPFENILTTVTGLTDTGKALTESKVNKISFTGSNKPAILMGKSDKDGKLEENYRYLLMPMRYAS